MKIISSSFSFDWGAIIVQLLVILIVIAVISLIVYATRLLLKRSGISKSKINIITAVVILIVLWFSLDFLGISVSFLVPGLIEWATKFILPWVLLYWFVRLIKVLERR